MYSPFASPWFSPYVYGFFPPISSFFALFLTSSLQHASSTLLSQAPPETSLSPHLSFQGISSNWSLAPPLAPSSQVQTYPIKKKKNKLSWWLPFLFHCTFLRTGLEVCIPDDLPFIAGREGVNILGCDSVNVLGCDGVSDLDWDGVEDLGCDTDLIGDLSVFIGVLDRVSCALIVLSKAEIEEGPALVVRPTSPLGRLRGGDRVPSWDWRHIGSWKKK